MSEDTPVCTSPLRMIGLLTAELSSLHPAEASYQKGLEGGSGMFLLGGLKKQHLLWQSPLVPAPYLSWSGAKGKMMQTLGGSSSGRRISEVRVWYSSVSGVLASSAEQKDWSSWAPFSVEGMNQVGFSWGGCWATARLARPVRSRSFMTDFTLRWLPMKWSQPCSVQPLIQDSLAANLSIICRHSNTEQRW